MHMLEFSKALCLMMLCCLATEVVQVSTFLLTTLGPSHSLGSHLLSSIISINRKGVSLGPNINQTVIKINSISNIDED